jgi:SAM-dependent methyltransferase
MHEILSSLPAGARILDLGCAQGSFPQTATAASVVRVDREPPRVVAGLDQFTQADAARLPFRDHVFDAVIANHSLEHFDNLDYVLREIRRVTRPSGALFVAVPDAKTLTDKLYRWLARGGGHVNLFTSARETASLIEAATGFDHIATKVLCSSLSFLNRCNSPRPLPRRLLLIGGGYQWSLFLYAWLFRRLDRYFCTRTSIYGWAFYFGTINAPIDTKTWVNVCVRCGSASSASLLIERHLVRITLLGFHVFRCPDCGADNPFADDAWATGWLIRETTPT